MKFKLTAFLVVLALQTQAFSQESGIPAFTVRDYIHSLASQTLPKGCEFQIKSESPLNIQLLSHKVPRESFRLASKVMTILNPESLLNQGAQFSFQRGQPEILIRDRTTEPNGVILHVIGTTCTTQGCAGDIKEITVDVFGC